EHLGCGVLCRLRHGCRRQGDDVDPPGSPVWLAGSVAEPPDGEAAGEVRVLTRWAALKGCATSTRTSAALVAQAWRPAYLIFVSRSFACATCGEVDGASSRNFSRSALAS